MPEPKRVACHSAVYLPWLGYFAKMAMADTFVILDNTQILRGRGVGYRNYIKLRGAQHLLSVPCLRLNGARQQFRDVRIDNTQQWRRKHRDSIKHAYAKAPHYAEIDDLLAPAYAKDQEFLIDLNLELILALKGYLGLETEIAIASQVGPDYEDASERLADLTARCGGGYYVSGFGGANYMRPEPFAQRGVEYGIYQFTHPQYPQYDGAPFVSNLAVIDCLFNCGPRAAEILRSSYAL